MHANLLVSCFEGFNVTVLAYGQTGSGKTYTMGSANNANIESEQLGIIPRVIAKIFDKVEAPDTQVKYTLKVSFLELYNEEIKDMLYPDFGDEKILQIREDPQKGIYVTGLTEETVKSKKEMENALVKGSLYRTTGSTLMNTESSRSHAIFTITIEQHSSTDNTIDTAPPSSIVSKFNFVDLAGSERIKRTGAEGQRMKEGININQGLLALGNVISALSDEKRKGKRI